MKKELNIKINSKRILQKLEIEGKRSKTSLYLSDTLLERFKEAIGKNASVSNGVELLMEAFLESMDKKN